MRHRAEKPGSKIKRVLLDAGLVITVVMGIALVALAVAVAFLTGMIE